MVSRIEDIWDRVARGERIAIRKALADEEPYADAGETSWAHPGERASLRDRFQGVPRSQLLPELRHALKFGAPIARARAAGLVADFELVGCKDEIRSGLSDVERSEEEADEGYVTDPDDNSRDLNGRVIAELLRAARILELPNREVYEKLLFDPNRCVREEAARNLALGRNPEDSLPVLAQALLLLPGGPLEESQLYIGEALERGLEESPDARYLDLLLKGLENDGVFANQAARRGLVGLLSHAEIREGLGDEWLSDIICLIASGFECPDEAYRDRCSFWVCQALADLNDARAIPFLMARVRRLDEGMGPFRKALTSLTGSDHGPEAGDWIHWYETA